MAKTPYEVYLESIKTIERLEDQIERQRSVIKNLLNGRVGVFRENVISLHQEVDRLTRENQHLREISEGGFW